MNLLTLVKMRCGIPESITAYDESEIKPLIKDCMIDLQSSGLPVSILPESVEDENPDPRVVTAISLYVLAHHGQDRSDTDLYMKMYRKKIFKLSLES